MKLMEKKLTMYEHVTNAIKNKDSDQFFCTKVIRWEPLESKFYELEEVADLTNFELNDVQKDNFIYKPFLTMEKTRLSLPFFQNI